MFWKEKLRKLESNEKWKSAIELMQNVIVRNKDDLDAYLSINYLLMNYLVEVMNLSTEYFSEEDHDYYAALLKKYYDESFAKFSQNPEYLFYTGITAHLSEWYFDIDINEAIVMIKKSLQLEPDNILYKWGNIVYLGMANQDIRKEANIVANEILNNSTIVRDIELKGSLGNYVFFMMKNVQ